MQYHRVIVRRHNTVQFDASRPGIQTATMAGGRQHRDFLVAKEDEDFGLGAGIGSDVELMSHGRGQRDDVRLMLDR